MINKQNCKINYNIAILEDLRCNRLMHYVGTDELEELNDILRVCTNRLRKDPLSEILTAALKKYANGNTIIVDMKKMPVGTLIENLNDMAYRAEPFRDECYKIIRAILMEHLDELTDRIKEVFPTQRKSKAKSHIPEPMVTIPEEPTVEMKKTSVKVDSDGVIKVYDYDGFKNT